MELRDYFEVIGAPVEVKFRDGKLASWIEHRFYATSSADIAEGSILMGAIGDGHSADEALRDFAKQYSNKRIKVGSTYHQTPKLEHTKLLNA